MAATRLATATDSRPAPEQIGLVGVGVPHLVEQAHAEDERDAG